MIKDIKIIPTVSLIGLLEDASKREDQPTINAIAYELACRIYVPNKGVNFDDMAKRFGYIDEEQEIKLSR